LSKSRRIGFLDKQVDSQEVVNLVEEIRSAILYYQVSRNHTGGEAELTRIQQISQQRSIYTQIRGLTVRLHVYVFYRKLTKCSLAPQVFLWHAAETPRGAIPYIDRDTGLTRQQKPPVTKEKINAILERLDWLGSAGDGADAQGSVLHPDPLRSVTSAPPCLIPH